MTNSRRSAVLKAQLNIECHAQSLGAVLRQPYVSQRTQLDLGCFSGHEWKVWPTAFLRSSRGCPTCAEQAQEQSDRERLHAAGYQLVDPYAGTSTRVRVSCKQGHVIRVRPGSFGSTAQNCQKCHEERARKRFEQRLQELGCALLGTYQSASQPVEVRCAAGHLSRPTPLNVVHGQGVCVTCAGKDPQEAALKFHTRMTELGATVEGLYVNTDTPVRSICSEGHICHPRPGNVLSGHGVCMTCRGAHWDTFYVVQSPETGIVKFGVTTTLQSDRLATHRRNGFTNVLRLFTNLPDGVAREAELGAERTLADRGFRPVRGREYFPGAAVTDVLDLVDKRLPQPYRVTR